MELYDSKFVYFDWDDKLEGKKGFFSNDINTLKQAVNDNRTAWYRKVSKNTKSDNQFPFDFIDEDGWHTHSRFCYYDPYYEFRKAYLEGKQLQFKNDKGGWEDVLDGFAPLFTTDEYRIKPETTWYIVLDDFGLSRCNSTTDGKVVFEGTEDECIKWYDKYKSFEKIMLAWKQGKTIQYKDGDEWVDWLLTEIPRSGALTSWKEWRIKKESEPVPFDSVQELIYAWEKKSGVKFNHELAMPFIWIKNKHKNHVYLITDFLFDKAYNCDVGTEDENLKLTELFEDFTFLDGSIIGKVKE